MKTTLDYPDQERRGRAFTLLELLVALAIVATGLALVGSRIGVMPSRLVVREVKTSLQTAFSEAGMRARTTGRPTVLSLDLRENRLLLHDRADAEDHGELEWRQAGFGSSTATESAGPFQQSYSLNQEIEWHQPSQDYLLTEHHNFIFFPDGDATGPGLEFTLRGYRFRLSVTRMTGKMRLVEIER